MRLYLVRHGMSVDRAEFAGPDEDRPLTAKGRRDLARLFRSLRGHEDPPEEIWTSPLVRTVQTAEICEMQWGEDAPIKVSRSLLFDAPVFALLDEIKSRNPKSPLALVGHEPQLGLLFTHLTGSKTELSLPKGSMCRIRYRPEEQPPGRFTCLHVAGREDVVVDFEKLQR
jgi:phosphohistidine phosphatase